MTKKGSIKETGEEISDESWKRFESAAGVRKGEDELEGRTVTGQPYRDEVEHRNQADEQKAANKKTTQRTE